MTKTIATLTLGSIDQVREFVVKFGLLKKQVTCGAYLLDPEKFIVEIIVPEGTPIADCFHALAEVAETMKLFA